MIDPSCLGGAVASLLKRVTFADRRAASVRHGSVVVLPVWSILAATTDPSLSTSIDTLTLPAVGHLYTGMGR